MQTRLCSWHCSPWVCKYRIRFLELGAIAERISSRSVSYMSSETLATLEVTSYTMSTTLSGFETRLESVEGLLGQLLARETTIKGSQQKVGV